MSTYLESLKRLLDGGHITYDELMPHEVELMRGSAPPEYGPQKVDEELPVQGPTLKPNEALALKGGLPENFSDITRFAGQHLGDRLFGRKEGEEFETGSRTGKVLGTLGEWLGEGAEYISKDPRRSNFAGGVAMGTGIPYAIPELQQRIESQSDQSSGMATLGNIAGTLPAFMAAEGIVARGLGAAGKAFQGVRGLQTAGKVLSKTATAGDSYFKGMGYRAARSAASGATYESGIQTLKKLGGEHFDINDVAMESALWAGMDALLTPVVDKGLKALINTPNATGRTIKAGWRRIRNRFNSEEAHIVDRVMDRIPDNWVAQVNKNQLSHNPYQTDIPTLGLQLGDDVAQGIDQVTQAPMMMGDVIAGRTAEREALKNRTLEAMFPSQRGEYGPAAQSASAFQGFFNDMRSNAARQKNLEHFANQERQFQKVLDGGTKRIVNPTETLKLNHPENLTKTNRVSVGEALGVSSKKIPSTPYQVT